MPNGEVHYRYYKKGYWFVLPVSVILAFVNWRIAMGILAGYTFHRWCDPDWDLMGASSSEGRMVRELPVIGHFLFGISSTYGSLHRKYHRKFISHFPAVSTAIRMLFVGLPVYLALHYFSVTFNPLEMWILLGFWIGLSGADAIHYVLDLFYGD